MSTKLLRRFAAAFFAVLAISVWPSHVFASISGDGDAAIDIKHAVVDPEWGLELTEVPLDPSPSWVRPSFERMGIADWSAAITAISPSSEEELWLISNGTPISMAALTDQPIAYSLQIVRGEPVIVGLTPMLTGINAVPLTEFVLWRPETNYEAAVVSRGHVAGPNNWDVAVMDNRIVFTYVERTPAGVHVLMYASLEGDQWTDEVVEPALGGPALPRIAAVGGQVTILAGNSEETSAYTQEGLTWEKNTVFPHDTSNIAFATGQEALRVFALRLGGTCDQLGLYEASNEQGQWRPERIAGPGCDGEDVEVPVVFLDALSVTRHGNSVFVAVVVLNVAQSPSEPSRIETIILKAGDDVPHVVARIDGGAGAEFSQSYADALTFGLTVGGDRASLAIGELRRQPAADAQPTESDPSGSTPTPALAATLVMLIGVATILQRRRP